MSRILLLIALNYFINITGVSGESCSKIRELLNDESITIGGPHNDICILGAASCCDKAVENKLLEKTRDILKNRVFLVLNQFYQTIDEDKKIKQGLLTKVITNTDLSQSKKMELNEKFSDYQNGVNSLTTLDLDDIKSASATGSLSKSLNDVAVSSECETQLYFEMENLKNTELKYISSILLMLRGYNIITDLITKAQVPELTEECLIGAVRGGLKFGGCELCYDSTEFAHPCVKLCRNILSGCLKGHVQTRDYIQYLTAFQIQLNTLVSTLSKERDTAVESLKAEVVAKLSRDKEFYESCSSLQGGDGGSKSPAYSSELGYDATDARNTLDSSWLCTYVFSGISEVNCWNRSAVDEYRLNVYEFTENGQFQNPEVTGDGPYVDISDEIEGYKDYKNKVEELAQGRGILEPSSALPLHVSLSLVLLLAIFLT